MSLPNTPLYRLTFCGETFLLILLTTGVPIIFLIFNSSKIFVLVGSFVSFLLGVNSPLKYFLRSLLNASREPSAAEIVEGKILNQLLTVGFFAHFLIPFNPSVI